MEKTLLIVSTKDGTDNMCDLKLVWDSLTTDNINSHDGIIVIIHSAMNVLRYAHYHRCKYETIANFMESNFYPITERLNNAFDFFLSTIMLIISENIERYLDESEYQKLLKDLIDKFIVIWIKAKKIFAEKKVNQEIELIDDFGVKVSTLIIGEVFKNYKELCLFLGEEVLEGNSKKAQLKEWGRYFLWEKKGQKFIILEVYDEPLSKEDGRKNKNIYVQYIEVILLKLLSNQKDDKDAFYITTGQLYKLLGMINDDYKNISLDDLNDRIPKYEITSFDVNKFYQRSNQRLREILYSSLNCLQQRALVKYDIQTIIVRKNKKNKLVHDVANDTEKKKIMKAERKTLLDMGLESKRQAFAKFKDGDFFSILNNYLKEWYGWEHSYDRIKILYNKSDVSSTVDKDIEKLKYDFSEVKLQRFLLNDKIVEALNKNAITMVENRHKKAEEEYMEALERFKEEHIIFGEMPDSFLPSKRELKIFDYLEYSPLFVEIQNCLTEELISIRRKKKKIIIECNDNGQKELDELFGG